jgi:hypothetical protein
LNARGGLLAKVRPEFGHSVRKLFSESLRHGQAKQKAIRTRGAWGDQGHPVAWHDNVVNAAHQTVDEDRFHLLNWDFEQP